MGQRQTVTATPWEQTDTGRAQFTQAELAQGFSFDCMYRKALANIVRIGSVEVKIGKTYRQLEIPDILSILGVCKELVGPRGSKGKLAPSDFYFLDRQLRHIVRAKNRAVLSLNVLMRLRRIAYPKP